MRRASAATLLSICALLSAQSAGGAQLLMTKNGPVHVFYVDGESLNGAFDTFYFQAKATSSGAFANFTFGGSGPPPFPGIEYSYANPLIVADPTDVPGGLGFTRVGLIRNPQEVSFTAGNLGGTVTTANEPNGDLFLANLYIPDPNSAFTATLQLISAGTVVFEAVQTIPEPSGIACGLVGLSALLAGPRLSKGTPR
jgi:hypothetical protein